VEFPDEEEVHLLMRLDPRGAAESSPSRRRSLHNAMADSAKGPKSISIAPPTSLPDDEEKRLATEADQGVGAEEEVTGWGATPAAVDSCTAAEMGECHEKGENDARADVELGEDDKVCCRSVILLLLGQALALEVNGAGSAFGTGETDGDEEGEEGEIMVEGPLIATGDADPDKEGEGMEEEVSVDDRGWKGVLLAYPP